MFDKSTKCNTDAINSSSSSLSVVCIYNSRLLLIWLTVSSRKDLSFAGAMSISPGIWLYQLTDDGLALELTAKGTKYYKDGKLN